MSKQKKHECAGCGGCDKCEPCSHCNACKNCGKPILVRPYYQYQWPWYYVPYMPSYTIPWGASGVIYNGNISSCGTFAGSQNQQMLDASSGSITTWNTGGNGDVS